MPSDVPLTPSSHRARRTLVVVASLVLTAGLAAAPSALADECGLLQTCEPSPPPSNGGGGSSTGGGGSQPEQQPAPEPAPSTDPGELLAMVNQVRADHGLGALAARGDVATIAHGHSRRMADANDIWHNDDYFSSGTRRHLQAAILAENVAMGPDLAAIHHRLMESPGHRANILDGRLTVAGFGVVAGPSGSLFVTQNFLRPVATPAATPPAAAAARPPASGGGEAPATTVAPADDEQVTVQHVGAAVAAPQVATPAVSTGPLERPTKAPISEDRWGVLAAALLALAAVATDALRRRTMPSMGGRADWLPA